MIQCKAAITDGKGNFSIENIEVNTPQKDEVLIQIKASGVCHTDWDSQVWNKPLIMGHEGAGVVFHYRAFNGRFWGIAIGCKVPLSICGIFGLVEHYTF
jgi:D-arabinose 1-dehydrogenase-like Zn-dependent alcohol dehydrogenase